MAVQIFATVTGAKQGAFKGETTQKGRENMIPVVAFDYGVTSPHDVATGQAAGKRQEQPVVFTKEWGASSPQFFAAAYTSEVLTSVVFDFFVTNLAGVQQLDHTVKLTNATIASVQQSSISRNPAAPSSTPANSKRSPLSSKKSRWRTD